MKDINKRFSAFRIVDPEKVKGRTIKNIYFNDTKFCVAFEDHTFMTICPVHDECAFSSIEFDCPMTVYEYYKLGFISKEVKKAYLDASIQSQRDSNTAWELKELERLKKKYEEGE